MIDLPRLAPNTTDFPPIESALKDPNGLLAFGGDLSPARIVEAYRRGIFPWFEDDQPILWWSPNPRLILKPHEAHVSKSMAKFIRKGSLSVTADTAFPGVIKACSEIFREGQGGTWITTDMVEAYTNLHHLGYAHSIEVWSGEDLVGGLYGIAVGAAFYGESMFSLVSNASKLALIHLAQYLQSRQFELIDCQMETPHLTSMGGKLIDRKDFKQMLKSAILLENSDHYQPKYWEL